MMSTGFMASGVVKHLDGVNGLAGWRWLFIVCAIATFPVSLIGFVFFPSTPDKTKSWFLTQDEKELARLRMARIGGKPPTGFSGWNTIRRFFFRWHFWALVFFQIPWGFGTSPSSNGAYTLWIKSLKQYSTYRVNLLSTINPGVGILFVWFYSFLSDALQTRMPIIVGQCIFAFVMQFAFVIWKSPTAYKWAALSTGYGQVSVSPLVYSWANEICREDAEERAFVIASMLAISNAFNAWYVDCLSIFHVNLTVLGYRSWSGRQRVPRDTRPVTYSSKSTLSYSLSPRSPCGGGTGGTSKLKVTSTNATED